MLFCWESPSGTLCRSLAAGCTVLSPDCCRDCLARHPSYPWNWNDTDSMGSDLLLNREPLLCSGAFAPLSVYHHCPKLSGAQNCRRLHRPASACQFGLHLCRALSVWCHRCAADALPCVNRKLSVSKTTSRLKIRRDVLSFIKMLFLFLLRRCRRIVTASNKTTALPRESSRFALVNPATTYPTKLHTATRSAYGIWVDTCAMWLHPAPVEDRMVVSEIGEQ